ncbi:MAG: hypothetical protein JJU05_18920 [Verrucomicrobia bacterium]|nr:hypothetical protein [Verrucomicrobiota bacterium]MCH8528332.1 hypothetical protein [Kiritimatiellia bacterium]
MAELEFEMSETPRKKAQADVAGWMVALAVITFVCFAGALTMQVMERMYLRGQLPSDADPYAAPALLP